MYPADIEIKDTTEGNTSASYLDLFLSIGRDGQLRTSFNDKRDDFTFHIINFPFPRSNIPSSPAYGVFISQLSRNVKACSSYECFIMRAAWLSYKFLDQGYVRERSISSLRKIYGRYWVLFKHYEVSLTTFWDKSVYSDMLHWTDISLVVTLLLNWSLLPTLTLLPDAGDFIRTFTTGAASQQLIRTPSPLWDIHLS